MSEAALEQEQTSKSSETAGANDAVESKARRMGWKPEDEWQGAPPKDGFRTAEQFIEHGEAELPILRERNSKLNADLAATNSRLDEMTGTLTEFKEHHAKTEERVYKRAKQDLQDKQRQAVADGDDKAFEAAAKKIDELDDDAAKATEMAKTPAKATPDDTRVFDAWVGDNAWYGDDMEMSVYADGIAAHVSKKSQATGRPYYDAIAAEVKKKFPDRFGNPNRNQAQTVESGGRMAVGGKRGKAYTDLPSDAKAACDRFVKQGLLTKAEYDAEYEWD